MFEELKKKRLELRKSIEEVFQITKIKKSYIEALEENRLNELPAEVYTRFYIKIYSEILGIDSKGLIEQYENYLNSLKRSEKIDNLCIKDNRDLEKKIKAKLEKYSRWIVLGSIIAGVFLVIFVVLYLQKKETYIPPPPPYNPQIQVQEKLLQQKEENIVNIEKKKTLHHLKIEAVDKVWMRIIIDDKEKREALLEAGQSIDLKAEKSFKLLIGNAGGVKVYFNNEMLDKLGQTGQVVYLKLPKE
jgi:transcriptional regulator with XRE-family HTH domain